MKTYQNSFISLVQLPGGDLGGVISLTGLGLGAALTVVRNTSKVPIHVWRNMLNEEFLKKIKIKTFINVFIIFHNNWVCSLANLLIKDRTGT